MSNVYYTLLTTVQSKLQAIDGIPTVTLRKKALLLTGDTLPLVIVAMGPGGEKIPPKGQQMGKGVWWDYPIRVAYLVAGDRLLNTGLQSFLLMRETIRDTLFQPILDQNLTPSQFDTNLQIEEAVDFGTFARTNVDGTAWDITYRSAEKRLS